MQRDLGPQDVAQRSVGVRQRIEQIGVLVVGACRDHGPARQEHVGLAEPVVHEAVAIARRLDADADRRTAHGDVLELGRYERQKPVLETVAHDGLVRRETFDLDGAGPRVEVEHVIELA